MSQPLTSFEYPKSTVLLSSTVKYGDPTKLSFTSGTALTHLAIALLKVCPFEQQSEFAQTEVPEATPMFPPLPSLGCPSFVGSNGKSYFFD